MKHSIRCLAFTALVGGLAACAPNDNGAIDEVAADSILFNAEFYTVNEAQPWAEAIAIRDGRIVFVGDEAGAREYEGTNTGVFDLSGNFVLPGFQDAHIHPLEGASLDTFFGCRLEELSNEVGDPELWIEYLKTCDDNERAIEWVLGGGHDLSQLVDIGRMPKEILDEALPDVPVALMEKSSHSFWVNSLALERAGISNDTPDPQGGIIVKDPDTGEPNGILTDSAGDEIAHFALQSTPELQEARYESLLISQDLMTSVGITSATNARVYWDRGNAEPWLRAEEEGTLKTRSIMAIWAYPHMEDGAQLATIKSMYRDDRYEGEDPSLLRWSQVKFYSDGVVSNNSGAVLEPYTRFVYPDLAKRPRGGNYFTEERLKRYITELERVGFDVHIHALADRAVQESLNAIEYAQSQNPDLAGKRRHQLTHISLIDEADIPRFAELGAIPNIQITYGDDGGEPEEEESPPEDEAVNEEGGWISIIANTNARFSPVIDIHGTGARVVISSDWDVSPMSPLVAVQTMIEQSAGRWTKDQALEFVLEAHTLNAAYAMQHDDVTGSIEVGKFADLVVLDDNLFEIPTSSIRHTEIVTTYLSGEPVYPKD